jgi:hypothetical protein
VNHDSIVIGNLNGVAIMSEDSQRLLPDLPSRIWRATDYLKWMIIARFKYQRFRISRQSVMVTMGI